MSLFRKWFPNNDSIRKEYVRMRQRDLDAGVQGLVPGLRWVIECLMEENRVHGDWLDYFQKIHNGLKKSDLTINFTAATWFKEENKRKTYSQMYEQGLDKKGDMKLNLMSGGNNVKRRTAADDLVSLPDEWAHAHKHCQRRRVYDAMNASGVTNESAYAAGNAPVDTPSIVGVGNNKYSTSNKKFLPKAKQVFAALNYGKRPHGSTTDYGSSYLVLKPDLKLNAFYYPGDTFSIMNRIGKSVADTAGGVNIEGSLKSGIQTQASYWTIGTIILNARPTLLTALWKSFVQNITLGDEDDHGNDMDKLLEAHLFKTIKVNKHVERMVLCRTKNSNNNPYRDWPTVFANATEYCKRNGIKLELAM